MTEIAISQLRKEFAGTAAVEAVDLSIRSGEFLVILGPSGCGKSTLLRLIAGLEDATGGRIQIGGTVVNDLEPGRRGCAMVFQNYSLYPHMSVAANIGYALKVAGVRRAERQGRVEDVARLLELDHLLDRKPGQLSGGQRQRVAMGRAMVRNPQVFLFDEPLSNLDAKLRASMRVEIKRLHRRLGTTSVFVTHDQLEAMTMADRMVLMNKGRIEQVGTPQDLFRRPASVFVAGFIGTPAMNLVPGRIVSDGTLVADGGWRLGGRWPLNPHTPVTVGMRPGALRLTAAPADGPVFRADLCEDLGSELHLHATSAELDLVVALPVDARPPSGPFGLTVEPEDLHLFHGETGQRVDPLPALQGDTAWQMQPSFT
ncbi:ABC transporter ATP-binding protein [Chachezhania sediminis]|uniref:ABC transporter ATP-binding protein n=1 Tax=Chachezhania sediminis TaxID=2599291 RepID=UPI00131AE61B|nr:sn-glycerol-3-phosphate ABC transporter ATP-binding protein UgpC [Chachezhania sediminis]